MDEEARKAVANAIFAGLVATGAVEKPRAPGSYNTRQRAIMNAIRVALGLPEFPKPERKPPEQPQHAMPPLRQTAADISRRYGGINVKEVAMPPRVGRK